MRSAAAPRMMIGDLEDAARSAFDGAASRGPREFRSASVALAILALLVLASIAIGLHVRRPPPIVYGDGPEYLVPAYNLAHHGVFSQDSTDEPRPGIGREPGYPVFLAALMRADLAFGRVPVGCLVGREACDVGLFDVPSLANLVLVQATGLALFALAFLLTQSFAAALAAAGYVLLNVTMNKYWYFPMSDWLALFLVSLVMLAWAAAWGRGRAWRWGLLGATLAVLTLTKAIFLPFALLVGGVSVARAALQPGGRRALLLAVCVAGLVYGSLVGGWFGRNALVAGHARLTDTRGGIALSTREVFDHMTPAQYAAAFVYWTRGPGPGWARKLFGADVVAPFDLEQPGGFYDRGQNGYGREVAKIAVARSVDAWTASARLDHDLEGAILSHPFIHALTTLPLLYRGIWVDEFAPLGIAALIGMTIVAVRRRDGLLLALLGVGIFNELFYALFSLNVTRYQTTAVPSIALAAALAARALWHRWRTRETPRLTGLVHG